MLESYRNNVALQNRLEIPSRIVDPEEVEKVVRHINLEGIVGGAYSLRWIPG
jgi:hypothetical protein